MKRKITTVFLFVIALQGFSRTIELDFPKLNERDTARIYYFSGSRVDSLYVTLNSKGKAIVAFPQKDYRGFAYLFIPQKGGGEMLIAENRLRVTCPEEEFNAGMLQFPQSAENTFINRTFQRRSYLLAQQEWLKDGEKFNNNKAFLATLQSLQNNNEKELEQLDDSIKTSPLYAARFMELTMFMQQLYATVQNPFDTAQQQILKNQMQYTLDINALYHSGNLWADVHTYYPGLFADANGDFNQQAYAISVGITMMRLQEPVLTAFLSTALTTCERNNWQQAQEVMLRDFLMTYPTLLVSDPKLKRMLGAYGLNKGSQAPALAGLSKPLTQTAILFFFESDCDHCRQELNWLSARYEEITAKGYRIISIAADTRENNYRNTAAGFTWDKEDSLCDFNGFEGENFKNYGIIGTPTIFVIDKDGVILGKYAKLEEIEF